MSKDPTPKADMLRAQREARYGHIQATSLNPTPSEAALLALMPKKMAPYAGKATGNGHSKGPVDKSPEAVAARKAVAAKRKPRKKKEKTS